MNTKAMAILVACVILSEADAAEEATLQLGSHPAIPTLDEMASDWLPQSQLGHYPSIHNFHGALLTNNLVVTSIRASSSSAITSGVSRSKG